MTSSLLLKDGSTAPHSMTTLSSTSTNPAMQSIPGSQALPASMLNPSSVGVPHSKSLPTTPSQKPQPGLDPRKASPISRTANNSSPLSHDSDSSQTPPARKLQRSCPFETGMARARRRVPYFLGPDKLDRDASKIKSKMSHAAEQKLTADMQNLYERIVPSHASEAKRAKFVEKLELILRTRWPGVSINVNVFGSTGNNLGTSDSDVDICITTDCKELTRVCSIAELLHKHGMERVVCVSSAKVPIVKVWDPELQVACDMNVNNPIALENTELVKAYVAIDPRVRPLAMIIKYWAKKRILNDAALGGTLSSYTWICLALNFLQTREPPILPSLQQRARGEPRVLDGVDVSFDKDMNTYQNFGQANKSSIGELLFQFFQYYGYELDFEQKVISVRLGGLIPKSEKGWHLLQDNRLCVEEPFNVSRNLANTADDTSMRGIHQEIRRAFGLAADGQLENICEQYVYPPEESRASEHFVPPSARPVIPQPPTQPSRGGKGAARGGRNTTNRNLGGRRSSNPPARTAGYYVRGLPFPMTTQELQLQAQHQQHLLHDQLFQQYQYLQLQEQELRMQLHQQNLRQRGLLASGNYPSIYGNYTPQDENGESTTSGGFSSSARAPLSAPLYQQRFGNTSPYLNGTVPVNGIVTNPSSPRLKSAVPETRRYPRRTSMTPPMTGTSLRAHSQPARPIAAQSIFGHGLSAADMQELNERRSAASSTSHEVSSGYLAQNFGIHGGLYDLPRRPAEYVGYYVGQSPSLLGYPQSASISPIPSQVGLAIHAGGLSPRLASSSLSGSNVEISTLGLQVRNASSAADDEPRQKPPPTPDEIITSPKSRTGPLIVNGSLNLPTYKRVIESSRPDGEENMTFSGSTSEDLALDTPSSSDEQSHNLLDSVPGPPASIRSPPDEVEVREPFVDSSKLPNGHVANLHKLNRGDPYRAPNVSRVEQIPSESQKPALTAWSLGRQLSAVQEVRTPSPGQDKHKRASNLSISSSTSQGASKLGLDKSSITSSTISSQETPALALRPNGTVPHPAPATEAGVTTQSSSWQTQKKKRKGKKTVKSENDAETVNPAGGDFPPLDESQRKGG